MGGLGGILFLFPAYVANRFPVTFVVIIVPSCMTSRQ
jgi:hypothetical protein